MVEKSRDPGSGVHAAVDAEGATANAATALAGLDVEPGSSNTVSLVLPVGRYTNVARLVGGAFAARLGLGFEDVDDLQLAIELVLHLPSVWQAAAGTVTLKLTSDPSGLTASLCGFDEHLLERQLPGGVDGGGIALETCLLRLVDSVELVGDPPEWLELGKTIA